MLTYLPQKTKPGSNAITINVELNGKPYGQLWTFRNTRTETHPWHAKPLNGEHRVFYAADVGDHLLAAKVYMEQTAR